MTTKTKTKTSRVGQRPFVERTEEASDAEMERYLAANHDEIEAKLAEARASIARGEAAPMEPLHVLLRQARKHAKAIRQ
jgi:hypothetical protein